MSRKSSRMKKRRIDDSDSVIIIEKEAGQAAASALDERDVELEKLLSQIPFSRQTELVQKTRAIICDEIQNNQNEIILTKHSKELIKGVCIELRKYSLTAASSYSFTPVLYQWLLNAMFTIGNDFSAMFMAKLHLKDDELAEFSKFLKISQKAEENSKEKSSRYASRTWVMQAKKVREIIFSRKFTRDLALRVLYMQIRTPIYLVDTADQ